MTDRDDRLQCPVAEACGGCAWIGEPYPLQLARKAERVRRALAARPALAGVPVEDCLPAPRPAAYRNRAKQAVRAVRGRVVAGLYGRGSNRVVSLAECRVQRPAVQRAMAFLVGWLARHRLARPAGPVFYVDVRESLAGRCHVTLVVDPSHPEPAAGPLRELVGERGPFLGVAINRGRPDSSFPLGPRSRSVAGEPTFRAPLAADDPASLAFEVPPAGFFQVGPEALATVHRRIAAHLDPEASLLDLYCGVGVHGLTVRRDAPPARRGPLHGVDAAEDLVACARNNAARLGIEADYRAARVEDGLADLLRETGAGTAIVNPGRAGCRPEALEALGTGPVRAMAYLSCAPDSLARDLDDLAGHGLRTRTVVPVDLMPQTDHVECLALLARGPGVPIR